MVVLAFSRALSNMWGRIPEASAVIDKRKSKTLKRSPLRADILFRSLSQT
jgi:hypothetical protein